MSSEWQGVVSPVHLPRGVPRGHNGRFLEEINLSLWNLQVFREQTLREPGVSPTSLYLISTYVLQNYTKLAGQNSVGR